MITTGGDDDDDDDDRWWYAQQEAEEQAGEEHVKANWSDIKAKVIAEQGEAGRAKQTAEALDRLKELAMVIAPIVAEHPGWLDGEVWRALLEIDPKKYEKPYVVRQVGAARKLLLELKM